MKARAWSIIIALTLGIFIIDLLTPPDLVVWLFYILPIFIASKNLNKRQVYLFMAALSVLVIIGAFFRQTAVLPHDVIINRTAGILAGWAIAILLFRQRENQESLRDLGEKFRTLSEESPVGNYLLQDEKFIYLNKWITDLLGYSKEELLALDNVLKLVHPEDLEKASKIMQNFTTGRMTRQDFEVRSVRKDGSVADLEMRAMVTMYKGQYAIIGNVIDISGRKEMERRQRDFTAMVTHDLKSPLTAIIGFSDILLEIKELDPESKEMAEAIRKNGKKLLDMVNYFLTVSRIQAGELKLRLAPEDPTEMLKELEKNFSSIAQQKGVSLKVDFAPMEKALLDRAYMERAISNLLQNAFNHVGPQGTVSLSAYSGVREPDGRRKNREFMAISVSDTGPGIPESELDRIFEKYYQSKAEKSGAAGVSGAGLGLAVVKAVADAHGGRAAVESAPGQGATFRIFMPVRANA